MIEKIKANLVFSVDLKSMYKSIWIGPLLITWYSDNNSKWEIENLSFNWYGWDYWLPQEIKWDGES